MMGREASKYAEDFRSRLTQARKDAGFTQETFAAALGLSRDTYAKYETRSLLPQELIAAAAGLTDIPLAYLLSGSAGNSGEALDTARAALTLVPAVECPTVIEIGGEEYAQLPGYDIRAAAGAGALNSYEEVAHHHLFRAQWLRTVTNAPANRLAVIQVDGDSMEPTLHGGDHVLIDRVQDGFRRDGIYVLDIGDGLQVKRVSMHPTAETLTIKSDNDQYPTYAGINPDEVRFVGRVIWLGRQV